MDVADAISAIDRITLWPEWQIAAFDYTARHESGVRIRLEYRVRNSDVEHAPEYHEWVEPAAHADFCLCVGNIDSRIELYSRVFAIVLAAVEHELREFFGVASRVAPIKPFHPHTLLGMANWANWHHVARPDYSDTVSSDIQFGSV